MHFFSCFFFKYRWYAFFFYDNKLNENRKDSFMYTTIIYIERDDDGKLLKEIKENKL